jgi:hypothetical protein
MLNSKLEFAGGASIIPATVYNLSSAQGLSLYSFLLGPRIQNIFQQLQALEQLLILFLKQEIFIALQQMKSEHAEKVIINESHIFSKDSCRHF